MAAIEQFRFRDSHGHLLDGRLEHPDGEPRAVALFAHCFTCTKQSRASTQIAGELAGRGFAVLRFDFTGLGGSEGDFANSGFRSNVGDLVAAADALRERVTAPAMLIGHSFGGAAVIAAAERIPEIRAVVTIAAPFHVDHVLARIGEGIERVREDGEAMVEIGGRRFHLDTGFLDEIADQPQAERLAALGRALLVMHSPQDALVGIENARQIFEAARHPKSFVALPGADHLLLDPEKGAYAAAVIAAWAYAYLDAPDD